MTKLEQFKTEYLSKLEGEDKEQILGAFNEVENVFNETIQRRDGVSKTNRELTDRVKKIGEALGFQDDYTMEDISSLLNNNNADVEAIKSELKTKYDEKYLSDFEKLKGEADESRTALEGLTQKYNDALFDSQINQKGLLEPFVDEAMARSLVTNKLKEQLLFKDGKIYAKDQTTGDVAYKIGSQEPYPIEDVVKNIADTIHPMYLKAQSNGGGGGSNPAQVRGNKKPADYTEQERVDLFRNNPSKFKELFGNN